MNQEQLQELLAYHANGRKVVSLYLGVNDPQDSAEVMKLRVKGLLKEAQQQNIKDVAAIEQYFNLSHDWGKPGLALFSADDGSFFRAYPTAVSFRNRVRVGRKPYVKPLAHLLDFYAHYGVVLVDRVGARFFEYHLGELQANDGYVGEDVQKMKEPGSSSVGMRGGQQAKARHEEETINRNLREAAAAATHFFTSRPIRRLFLGGSAETIAQFRELLPKQLQSCLAETFAMDMNAGEHEVRQRTLTLLRETNAVREKKLVELMITQAAKAGNAVTGLDDTLEAISERRVQTLILSDGFRTSGYVDEESGYVVANLARSPMSDKEMMEVEDVVDYAFTYTLNQGGHVEVISENPDLEQIGRIGAILRY